VLGDGPLALITAQVLVKMNASVRVVGRAPARFGLCEKWGIKHRAVDEVGLRGDQDVVIDCTGSADGLAVALGMVRPRGKVVLKTPWPGAISREESLAGALASVVLHEVEVIGSFLGPMHEAVTALAENQVDVVSLIGRRFPLSDGVAAIKAAAAADALKVIVTAE
jgi:threonine dehydrogenase-like Zn-dependent dehydrogenase